MERGGEMINMKHVRKVFGVGMTQRNRDGNKDSSLGEGIKEP